MATEEQKRTSMVIASSFHPYASDYGRQSAYMIRGDWGITDTRENSKIPEASNVVLL